MEQLAGPVSNTTRSAEGATLVLTRDLAAEPLLLLRFGSKTGDVDCAMFINELTDAEASNERLKVVTVPGASVMPFHVTTPLLTV